MVVTAWAPTAEIGVTQLRTGLPSRWTVQAPHWATPQPYFGPVMPRVSLRVQSSGVSGSTSASNTLPLTLSLKAIARAPVVGEFYSVVRRGGKERALCSSTTEPQGI